MQISEFLYKRGARLFLVDQNQTKLSSLAEILTGSKSICANICDEVQTEKVAAKIENKFGFLDGAINTVGIFAIGPALELDPKIFRNCIDVNLSGALIFSQLAAQAMNEKGGRIIHLASVSSQVANIHYAPYSSSKAALTQLVKVLGREWAPRKILVNAIGPAMVEGEMSKNYLVDPKFHAQALDSIPMGRFCKPTDLFGTILLLLGAGGEFITGQTLFVDGGRTLV